MRVLITGASGFVGPHLVDSLQRVGVESLVLTSKDAALHPELGRVEALDVTDKSAADKVIASCAPDCVIHLAGIAAPAVASADPQMAWRVHLHGTLNLAYSILKVDPRCNLLFVGSGMVYGTSASSTDLLDEQTLLAPIDEYAVTKAAADLALGALARRGLKCIRLRPFNHTGPGQDEAFMVPGFAMQIARIEAGLQPPVIRVGNLDTVRDILHVRDVTDAYALAAKKGAAIAPGTVLNVCSGTGQRVSAILDRLLALSGTKITVEQDPLRMRPSDLPRVVGDPNRTRQLLGWKPRRSLGETVADVLEDCRRRVAKSA